MTSNFIGTAGLICLGFLSISAPLHAGPNDSDWIPLFNKADTNLRNNWDIKITGSALNVDANRTFRWAVAGTDTVIEMNYSNYTSFNNNFGHLCYKLRQFSYYLIRAEYTPLSLPQPTGVPASGWTLQNNGLMLHAQSAASMTTSQQFPQSMEAQLLGPDNTAATPNTVGTLNLCTPETHWYNSYTGSANTTHCVASSANTRAPVGQWMYVAALMLGDSVGRFYVGNASNFTAQNVFTFWRPRRGETGGTGTYITQGYVHVQAEGAPYRFRRIEALDLVGCMTPGDVNYKSYLLRHSASACGGVTGVRGSSPNDARRSAPMIFTGHAVKVGGNGYVTLEIFDLNGVRAGTHAAQAPFQWTPSLAKRGLYVVRAHTAKGAYTETTAQYVNL